MFAHHGVGFARARLSVGEYGHQRPQQELGHERAHHGVVDKLLGGVTAKDAVERVGLGVGVGHGHGDVGLAPVVGVAPGVDHPGLVGLDLSRNPITTSDHHLDMGHGGCLPSDAKM